ncbi:hypothetical protein GWK47_052678 [Chionoecetes opilio]|uniref:Uncharacterized protein n=1 Tax=Chionoecetes opilio TaxID=41210 RepID=A0A8J4XZR4_CHIOP|nr:hypothetical protein GWK47_052678 [Chionoecetes opilio]
MSDASEVWWGYQSSDGRSRFRAVVRGGAQTHIRRQGACCPSSFLLRNRNPIPDGRLLCFEMDNMVPRSTVLARQGTSIIRPSVVRFRSNLRPGGPFPTLSSVLPGSCRSGEFLGRRTVLASEGRVGRVASFHPGSALRLSVGVGHSGVDLFASPTASANYRLFDERDRNSCGRPGRTHERLTRFPSGTTFRGAVPLSSLVPLPKVLVRNERQDHRSNRNPAFRACLLGTLAHPLCQVSALRCYLDASEPGVRPGSSCSANPVSVPSLTTMGDLPAGSGAVIESGVSGSTPRAPMTFRGVAASLASSATNHSLERVGKGDSGVRLGVLRGSLPVPLRSRNFPCVALGTASVLRGWVVARRASHWTSPLDSGEGEAGFDGWSGQEAERTVCDVKALSHVAVNRRQKEKRVVELESSWSESSSPANAANTSTSSSDAGVASPPKRLRTRGTKSVLSPDLVGPL